MRPTLIAVLAVVTSLLASACGGTTPTSPTSTPAPSQYPNMLGSWSGTLVIVAVTPLLTVTNICAENWRVNNQNGGQFSGPFTDSGGTSTPCAQTGTVSGNVTTTGAISGLTYDVATGLLPCVSPAGHDVFSGSLQGQTLTAQTTDALICTTGGLTFTTNRSLTIAMTKQ
jgi:hypothetical protein